MRLFGGGYPTKMALCALVAQVVLSAALASQVLAAPTAEQIAAKVRHHLDKVNDYACDMTFTASGPDLYVGKTVVRVYYKKPGRVHFEAKEGFAVLPNDMAFVGDPLRDVLDRLAGAKVRSERLDGAGCYVIEPPKDESGIELAGKFWVEKKRWLVVRADSASAYGGAMSGRISYSTVSKKFWMPSRVKIRGKTGAQSLSPHRDPDEPRPKPTSFTAEIVFSNYKINTGIPESVFKPGGKTP